MKNSLEISIETLDKQKLPIGKKILKDAVFYLLDLLKIKRGQFNIYFVSGKTIQRLNRIYLNKNYPTDVLAFNLSDKDNVISAEIFICPLLAKENALIYRSSFRAEIFLYIIHAILHILGFRDRDKKNRKMMFKKQKEFLGLLSDYIYTKYKIRLN